jgi:hypothetical protein
LRSSSSNRASGRTWCSGRWLGVARLVAAAPERSRRMVTSSAAARASASRSGPPLPSNAAATTLSTVAARTDRQSGVATWSARARAHS